MTDNMQAFVKLASEDKDVQAKLDQIAEAADKELSEGIIALAKENGIELTADDLKDTVSEEMSDSELEQVAGGKGGCVIIGAGGGHSCFIVGSTAPGEIGCLAVGF